MAAEGFTRALGLAGLRAGLRASGDLRGLRASAAAESVPGDSASVAAGVAAGSLLRGDPQLLPTLMLRS